MSHQANVEAAEAATERGSVGMISPMPPVRNGGWHCQCFQVVCCLPVRWQTLKNPSTLCEWYSCRLLKILKMLREFVANLPERTRFPNSPPGTGSPKDCCAETKCPAPKPASLQLRRSCIMLLTLKVHDTSTSALRFIPPSRSRDQL